VRRTIAWFLCVLASALCASSARPTSDALLSGLDGVAGGGGYRGSRPDTPYLSNDLLTCLDRPGRAVIDRIDVVEASGGLAITDFAVMPGEDMSGFVPDNRSLADRGLSAGPIVVDRQCTRGLALLLLEYRKPGDETAASHGFVIHYTSGHHSYIVTTRFEMVLCSVTDVTTPGCRSDG
jgi:hypothetical protein